MRLIPIRPKKKIIDVLRIDANVHRDLRDFGVAMQGQMKPYPPALPWKNKPPSRGLRHGIRKTGVGKRTGSLKRGWGGRALHMSRFKMDLTNQVPYGMYVQGHVPGFGKGHRQTAVMRARGWQNITDSVNKTWPKYKLRLQKSLAGK